MGNLNNSKWITLHTNTKLEEEVIFKVDSIIAVYEAPLGGTELILSNGKYFTVKEDFTEVKAEMFI